MLVIVVWLVLVGGLVDDCSLVVVANAWLLVTGACLLVVVVGEGSWRLVLGGWLFSIGGW